MSEFNRISMKTSSIKIDSFTVFSHQLLFKTDPSDNIKKELVLD